MNSKKLKISVDKNSKRTPYFAVYNYVNNNNLLFEDVRLMNTNDKIYIYSRDTKLICEIKVFNDVVYLKQLYATLPAVEIQGHNHTILHIEDKLPIIDSKYTATRITYLDWFYKDDVRIYAVNFIKKKSLSGYASMIKWDDYSIKSNIDGHGSYIDNSKSSIAFWGINYGIAPGLSFGCPTIINKDHYVGVGHIKIHSDTDDYPYLDNSNIQNFRRNLYSLRRPTRIIHDLFTINKSELYDYKRMR